MNFRESVDDLMSNVTVNEGMRRAIMEGKPQNAKYRSMSHTADTGRGRTEDRKSVV